jgi:hypothetical protein
VKIRLRPGADLDRLKEALREGGPAEVLRVAREEGEHAPSGEEIRRWRTNRAAKKRRTSAGKLVADCVGKTRYHDEEDAKRQKRRLSKKRGDALRAYSCVECGGWHLTRAGAG